MEKVTKASLSADIPLYKITTSISKPILRHWSQQPSETTVRKAVLQLRAVRLQRMRNDVDDKQSFLVDESALSGIQYLNILAGSLQTSHVSYLYDCQPPPCAPNSISIAQAVDNAVRSLGINRNSFCLVLSDAAKYTVAASAIPKPLYVKLFHLTCVA